MAFASPTDAFTSTDLQYSIPEIWGDILQEKKFAVPTIVDWATNLSSYFVGGGDTLHVPDLFTTAFAASTQSTQANAVVDTSPAQSEVQLAVNTHKYVAYIMGDKDMVQLASQLPVNEAYARQARRLLIQELEDDLFELWSDVSTNTVGDTASEVTESEIRNAIEKLASTNFELGQCAFFFHTYAYWNQILGIQKFYDASQWGGGTPSYTGSLSGAPMENSNGRQGTLFGLPVFTSSRVVSGLQTHRNLLVHREAMGYAVQTPGGAMVRVQSDYLVQNLGLLVVADIIYGVKMLRESAAVLINSSNTYLVS